MTCGCLNGFQIQTGHGTRQSIVAFEMQTEVAGAVQRERATQRQTELPDIIPQSERTEQPLRREPNRGRDMSRYSRKSEKDG